MEIIADPVQTLQGEAIKRIIAAGVFESSAIQRENTLAPDVLPYCRVTVPQGGDFAFDSQTAMSKTVIVEFDVMTSTLSSTQTARQLASKIEAAFGLFSRSEKARVIELPGWSGVSAVVSQWGRGSASVESEKGLYYLPVLLYVNLRISAGAKYEI